MGDWTTDLLFQPDVSMIKRFVVKENYHHDDLGSHNMKKELEKTNSPTSENK
jgi:hypothetical protein